MRKFHWRISLQWILGITIRSLFILDMKCWRLHNYLCHFKITSYYSEFDNFYHRIIWSIFKFLILYFLQHPIIEAGSCQSCYTSYVTPANVLGIAAEDGSSVCDLGTQVRDQEETPDSWFSLVCVQSLRPGWEWFCKNILLFLPISLSLKSCQESTDANLSLSFSLPLC